MKGGNENWPLAAQFFEMKFQVSGTGNNFQSLRCQGAEGARRKRTRRTREGHPAIHEQSCE